MKSITKKQAGKCLENHIINGNANLRYNKEQFDTLDEKQKKDFIWFALVQLNLVPNTGISNTPENFDANFELIQANKANYKPYSYGNKTSELKIGNATVTSAAQAMTLIAYGDSNKGEKAGIPFRSLSYEIGCDNYQDFITCINIIHIHSTSIL